MRKLILTFAVIVVMSACATQEKGNVGGIETNGDRKAQTKEYSAKSFFDTTSFSAAPASGFTYSPDGSTVLLNSDQTGVFNAYSVDTKTGERNQLTTSSTNANFGVSFFPNDTRILYTADNGGDELNHVWVRELDGSLKDLTQSENTKAQFLGWKDDNSKFYISTNERDSKAFDVYAYDVKAYARELIFENNNALSVSAISPNGRWLALTKQRTNSDSNVYLKDLTAEQPAEVITAHEGNIAYGVYAFTPNNQSLILATNEYGEFNQAWSYSLADGSKKVFAQADWDVSFVGFSKAGKYQYVGINEDAVTKVTISEVASGRNVVMPPVPKGNIQNIRFSKDDTRLAFLLNGDTSPSDLYVTEVAAKNAKRLTKALNPAINQDDLVEATIVRYDSFDGTKIPSVLYKPKRASSNTKVPALVLVHGGPGGQTTKGYRALVQHLVNHGYAVLGANNRGSSGYGKTFFHMDDKAHGEGDLQDIVWGKKYLQSLDWVDSEKIGIIGGSYGGYMVAAALAFEPDVFEVGINIFGVTNWVRTLKSIPPWWEAFKEALYDEMGDPATDEDRLRRISPLFHAENIVKPLLVVQGANDPRVLQVESDELVAAVKANKIPVEYVVFSDEGHGFRAKKNRITASEAYLTFLTTYLPKTN